MVFTTWDWLRYWTRDHFRPCSPFKHLFLVTTVILMHTVVFWNVHDKHNKDDTLLRVWTSCTYSKTSQFLCKSFIFGNSFFKYINVLTFEKPNQISLDFCARVNFADAHDANGDSQGRSKVTGTFFSSISFTKIHFHHKSFSLFESHDAWRLNTVTDSVSGPSQPDYKYPIFNTAKYLFSVEQDEQNTEQF